MRIGVFVPGFVEGSPTYEMLVAGVEKAAADRPALTFEVSEAGYNQAEWLEKLTALAASGKYDVIVTSNPAMPSLCAEVTTGFPRQKFIVIDGYLAGNDRIHSVIFNQVEQGYLIGTMAALVTTGDMAGANAAKKVGMIVGQRYPAMDQAILPGFEKGLAAVDPAISLDFRVVGNWYDAAKASELAESMFAGGVDVILTIAGGANQGVVAAARDRGRYVLWFDSNGYAVEPGVVVGSSAVAHDVATATAVTAAVDGKLEYGKAQVLGAADGFVRFIDDDPLFVESVPEPLRRRMAAVARSLIDGTTVLPMPEM